MFATQNGKLTKNQSLPGVQHVQAEIDAVNQVHPLEVGNGDIVRFWSVDFPAKSFQHCDNKFYYFVSDSNGKVYIALWCKASQDNEDF